MKINVVSNGEKALEYLTKYIAKPCEIDWEAAPAKMIDEWLDALPRQRLVIHFGDWPETEPLPEDSDWKEENRNWKPIFDLELICRLSALGQPAAVRLLLKLKKEKEP